MANLKYKNSNNQWKSLSAVRGPKGDNADITLNGTSSNNISIYAPISSGLSGQILQSNGANENPTWIEHQMPTVNNAILDIQKNGISLGIFSANANENKTINIEVPIVEDILNRIYPIGSIYVTFNNTNPGTFLIGEWQLIKDRIPIGAGNLYTARAEGGSLTHEHATKDHILQVNEIPEHHHTYFRQRALNAEPESRPDNGTVFASNTAIPDFKTEVDTYNTGGSEAHNHGNTDPASSMPPYIAMYFWERIN